MSKGDTAIKIEGLGKKYRIGARASYFRLTEAITNAARAPFRRRPAASGNDTSGGGGGGGGGSGEGYFWALKDVNFEVARGEAIGIIGRNGAGKSTLLKILSRITEMTTGTVDLYGRVGSLLEVGTGFHPELTGRENIYLNAAILGMKRPEIRAKFDDIVAFAEVEKFLDTPVKRYSSGMYMRLAFAVASQLEPEILVVDEVLAVGDAAFQKKCLGRMGEVAGSGRTVLFVSHNMGAISRLCQRAVWLDQGQVKLAGPTAEVIAQYLQQNSNDTGRYLSPEGPPDPSGVDYFHLYEMEVRNDEDQVTSTLDVQKPFFVTLRFRLDKPLPYCRAGFLLKTAEGAVLFETYDSDHESAPAPREPGQYVIRCRVPGDLLSPGIYYLSVNIGVPNMVLLTPHTDDVMTITIEDTGAVGSGAGLRRLGVIRPKLEWTRV